MATPEPLIALLNTLGAPQARYAELSRYYEGLQELAFISPATRRTLRDRLSRSNVNICRLAIQSLLERLQICGFEGNSEIWDWWLQNELDLEAEIAHRECLVYGTSYALVWANADGSPNVTVESARQMAVSADPATRQITGAVKKFYTDGETHAYWYTSQAVFHYAANTASAANTAFQLVEEIPNPLGVVPVVQFRNSGRIPISQISYPDRLLEYGTSDLQDLLPLVDLLSKTLADMAVCSELTAMPARYATGIQLAEAPSLDDEGEPVEMDYANQFMHVQNPFEFAEALDRRRMMIADDPDAKLGQLPGADMSGYESMVRVITSAIMAVTCLPASELGILSSQPTSADAYRAAAMGLTARAESKQRSLGKAWDRVAKLMVAVADGVDPASVNVRVKWSPAEYRSMAEAADAMSKLSTMPLYSRETALAKMGLSQDEIQVEIQRLQQDGQLGADIRMGRYMTGLTDAN